MTGTKKKRDGNRSHAAQQPISSLHPNDSQSGKRPKSVVCHLVDHLVRAVLLRRGRRSANKMDSALCEHCWSSEGIRQLKTADNPQSTSLAFCAPPLCSLRLFRSLPPLVSSHLFSRFPMDSASALCEHCWSNEIEGGRGAGKELYRGRNGEATDQISN